MAKDDSRFIALGPFSGGINIYSNSGAIGDNELVDCVNFVPTIDGSLKCRPPIALIYEGNAVFGNLKVECIGSAVLIGIPYVFFSNNTGIYAFDNGATSAIPYLISPAGVWARSCVQYKDFVYFPAVSGSAQPGGRWQGSTPATWLTIAAIPRGEACVIFKERMWLAPGTNFGSRLKFSNVGDPTTWGGADFFDISPGDGSDLVDAVVFNNNLLLLKKNSTHYLSYDAKPADATIVKISNTIGSWDWRCMTQYQNNIFTMRQGEVYQLVNFNWVQINVKVPFVVDGTTPGITTRRIRFCLSVIGDWLVCRYHNTVYVYNLITQSWSRWNSADPKLNNTGPFVKIPGLFTAVAYGSYYCGSDLDEHTTVMRINDGWDAVTGEWNGAAFPITSSILTKNYSFNVPWKFKRLFHWGVECITANAVNGTAIPNSITTPPTVATNTGALGGVTPRRVYRFLKGLRFREIQFSVTLTSDGTTVNGPAQIYIAFAVVKATETVSKAIN